MTYAPWDAITERRASATLSALNAACTLDAAGAGSVSVHVAAGLVGTLVAEVLAPDGATWEATTFVSPSTGAGSAALVNPTAATYFVLDAGSARSVRVRVSLYTSGSSVVDVEAAAHAPTGGSFKSTVRGGAKGGTSGADVTSTAQGSDHNSLDVQVYHAGAAVNPSAQGTAAAVGGAWPTKVTDGTNTAAVKAASTAAAASDPALVVQVSPNDPKFPALERTATGTLNSGGSTCALACPGAGAALVHVGAGLVGTLVPEYLSSDGTTWETGAFVAPLTGVQQSSLVSPAAGSYYIAPSGTSPQIRVRCSAYTSGSSIVFIDGTAAVPYFTPATSGSATVTMADAEANSAVGRVGARVEGYNGATFDLLRASKAGVSSNVLSAWTGVPMHQPYGQYAATRPSLTDGQGSPFMAGSDGILLVRETNVLAGEDATHGLVWTATNPVSDNTNALTDVDTAAFEVSHVLKASSGRLFALDGAHYVACVTASITASAQEQQVYVDLTNPGAGLTVDVSGTFSAVLQFEAFDPISNAWVSATMTAVAGGTATSASATGTWNIAYPFPVASANLCGYPRFRIRCSSYTSGTAVVKVGGTGMVFFLQLFNTASVPADGTVPVHMPIPLRQYEPVGPKLAAMGLYGRYFSTGISACISSTPDTKKIIAVQSGANACWFHAGVR